MTVSKPELTVCILAKNEEVNIERALRSARPLAKEIIVVDTGSTDRTVEIAESYGAKVVHHPWTDDFADARNAGLAHATGDWVLMLDADEAISAELARRLPKALKDPTVDAYISIMANYVDGALGDGGAVMRLFRNRPEYRYQGRVHESITESIVSLGGRLKTLHAPIDHFGYVASEDQRKGRRDRNIRLLKAMLSEDPSRASTWYFLGVEHSNLQEFGESSACFRKALQLDPTDQRSHLGAHQLVGANLLRHRLTDDWELALTGRQHEVTRWDSLMRTAQVALYEGDYASAADALAEVKRAAAGDFGRVERDPATLLNLEAQALWLQGRRADALRMWERGVLAYPGDQGLSTEWVRHRVLAEGLRAGALGSLQAYKTPQIVAAAAGALLRGGEYDLAATLSRNTLERSHLVPYTLYGLVRAGRVEEAEQVALNNGLSGAVHLATAAAWFELPAVLERSLESMTPGWRSAFEATLAERPVEEEHLWALDIVMGLWADAGCLKLLDAAAKAVSPEPAVGVARVAWLLYQTQQAPAALERALRAPDQPDAQEVLGLISAEHGDWEAAAQFLVQRAFAGPAPVRVYYTAARAFHQLGRRAEAQEILQLGLSHRPHSKLLKQGLPR